MIVINLYSGPCAGKSTLAADIFSKLKRAGVQAEIPPEVAKIRAQRGDIGFLNDQLAVFAETHHQLAMTAKSGAQVAVLDSPLLLSLIYAPKPYLFHFPHLVRDVYDQYENLNFVLQRSNTHPYSEVGRVHSEQQAHSIDNEIISLLRECDVQFDPINSSEDSARHVVGIVLNRLQSEGSSDYHRHSAASAPRGA